MFPTAGHGWSRPHGCIPRQDLERAASGQHQNREFLERLGNGAGNELWVWGWARKGLEWDWDGGGGLAMAVVPGPALGTALGFAQPLRGHGCSSAPMAAGELMPSPSRDPFPAEGPLSGVKRRMKGLISAPQTLHSPDAGQCCDPTAAAVPVGSREGWGSGEPPTSAAFFCTGLMETRLCSRERAWKPYPAAGVPLGL